MTGQYSFSITQVKQELDLPVPQQWEVNLVFAGYQFYDNVDSLEFAIQMKTDIENKFKILRNSESDELFVCYAMFSNGLSSEPKAIFSKELDARIWCKINKDRCYQKFNTYHSFEQYAKERINDKGMAL